MAAQEATARTARKLFTLVDWLEEGHSVNEILNGVNRAVVAELMGHASLDMVSKVYVHLADEHAHLKAAVERVRSEHRARLGSLPSGWSAEGVISTIEASGLLGRGGDDRRRDIGPHGRLGLGLRLGGGLLLRRRADRGDGRDARARPRPGV